MTFTPWVTLPGEKSSDVHHPFRPGTPPRHVEAVWHKKFFMHNTQPLQNLLKERKQLFCASDAPIDSLTRTNLQEINAEIKLTYVQIKRDK
ncbi:hypothetical protein NPIL_376401 [Nephila pilipes]|uniref:Uncharacterized protein n=1 Tax=Nephila pilipes TaxID=299642 RepID=A0A8X6NYR4_NEPPI|nr:hypothetical protein NPIL_376401 [Nephila pilipes]